MSVRRLFACAAAVICGGCVPTVDFDVPVSGDTTVDKGSLLEQVLDGFGFGSFVTMDLSQSQQFQDNDTRKDQVTSTKLTKLTLSVTEPVDGNFDFLDKIAFSAAADGVDKAEVAHKDVPDGVRVFDCDLDDVELAPYVKAKSMSITADVTARHPAETTTVHVDANFHVTAEVVGK